MSLSDFKVTVVLPVSDLDRSKEFYEEKLDLDKISEKDQEVLYQCGGDTTLLIYMSPSEATPSGATAATWEVDNLTVEMSWLKTYGVVFEEYDFDELRTINGVAIDDEGRRSAWFKDPDGNLLCLHETP